MEKKTKEISYKVRTRGMDREFNSILMGDKEISLNGTTDEKISFENSQKALDFMISSLTDLMNSSILSLEALTTKTTNSSPPRRYAYIYLSQ